jgi:hypothetical protein
VRRPARLDPRIGADRLLGCTTHRGECSGQIGPYGLYSAQYENFSGKRYAAPSMEEVCDDPTTGNCGISCGPLIDCNYKCSVQPGGGGEGTYADPGNPHIPKGYRRC